MDKEQLLYQYFSNGLTPEQEQRFDELLATDTEFKQQFDFEKNLQSAIRDKQANELKAKLTGFEKDVARETPVRHLTVTNYRKWALAASIALLVGLGWLGYHNFIGPDYGNLYDKNFQQYPNTVYAITRGDGDDTSLKRKAFTAYETDNNVLAIELFKELQTTQNTESITFYLAQSYLKNGQAEEAIELFKGIIANKGEFAPQALWYESLVYVKTGQKEKALGTLKNLVNDGRYKKTEAFSLLEKLE